MSEFSDLHYKSDQVTIGTFYCPANHPVFPYAGEMDGYNIVFPRTVVKIVQEGHSPVIADPNVVMFYNKSQLYQRGKISEQGDLCDWFDFDHTAVLEAVRVYDQAVDERCPQPFCFTHGLSVSSIYLQQRRLIHYLRQTNIADSLFVEGIAFAILQQALATVYQSERVSSGFQSHHPHYDLVHWLQVKGLRQLSRAMIQTQTPRFYAFA